MKTIRFISFLVFFSYIQCQTLQRSLLDAALQHINSQNYLEENLRHITSIMVAQFLQKSTYEEVQTVVKELVGLAEKCKVLKSHESLSECSHQLMTVFLEHICNNQGMADKHLFSECCSINNTARLKCFLLNKKDDAGYNDIFQIPNPEQTCEMDKENQVSMKERVLVLLTKKQPKASFSEIAKLAMDVKNLHQICCEGNTAACVLGRSQLMNYICSNQSILSSKIAPCCVLPEPFRGECIINSENDDKPDLSCLPISRFTEDQFVCQQFTDKQDDFLHEFLYEYSRRHPELAVPVILRVDTVYRNLLGKCCKLENPLECYGHGKEMLQRVVRESREHVKNHCDLREELGESDFHDRLVVLYTKKAPQLSAQELVMFTKNLAAASTKCCPLSDEQQFVCMEDSAKLILGALCRRHEAEPINAAVGHCCDNSYAFRKPCFDDLTVDGTYVSPHSSCDQVIGFKEELCKAQEEEFQTEKRKLLSNLVKQVPLATEMQLQSVTEDFAHLVRKCCQAETRGPCFREEGFKLMVKCQALLGG
ncbi:alpha-fetoprotein-like isoform X3 [Manis javanica]|uniref:alpha-fetoprotein-like isoform X3 n=1 Tax=Manis javanica TaxID=9974 RepID=UPI003C6D94F5